MSSPTAPCQTIVDIGSGKRSSKNRIVARPTIIVVAIIAASEQRAPICRRTSIKETVSGEYGNGDESGRGNRAAVRSENFESLAEHVPKIECRNEEHPADRRPNAAGCDAAAERGNVRGIEQAPSHPTARFTHSAALGARPGGAADRTNRSDHRSSPRSGRCEALAAKWGGGTASLDQSERWICAATRAGERSRRQGWPGTRQ